MRRAWAAALATALLGTPVLAQDSADPLDLYVFGNSLLVHPPGEGVTNVPIWLDRFAEAQGTELRVQGEFGFLRDFAELPPDFSWGFPGVTQVPGKDPAGLDAVILTPTNFIQWQEADRRYGWGFASPLSVSVDVIEWIEERAPGRRWLVYEGWSDMEGTIESFPPTDSEYDAWLAAQSGEYDAWYGRYVGMIRDDLPDLDIAVIPVAPVLAEMLSLPALRALGPEAFFSDDAPHGTEATYFLAALITHAALWQTLPSEALDLPDSLPGEVIAAYPELLALIAQAMPNLGDAPRAALATGTVQIAALETQTDASSDAPLPPSGARPDGAPALAMGLNGISDWSTQHPFLDMMKSARPWIGHLPGQWGGISVEEMQAQGILDENGWPLRLPDGAERIEALILTDQPREAQHLRGFYEVRWEGKAKVALTGLARRASASDGSGRFFYEPGEGSVGISISEIDPDDPIRAISVVREDYVPLWEAGALFNPDWLARIEDVRTVRFMDWMSTNGSPQEVWDDRPRVTDYSWMSWGVPLEVMLALANRIGADPWFTLPHRADDAYVRAFARQVREGLDPGLKAYVEYSNEVWNFLFPQAQWAQAQAEALWGDAEGGWMQFYGLRAAQVMEIFGEVFGDETSDRLVRVLSTHTAWPGLEDYALMAPLGYLTLGHPPQESFDAYAVTGYFGHEPGSDEMASEMERWLGASEDAARRDGEAQGLQRVALREYVTEHRFDAAVPKVAEALAAGSLKTLIEELFPHHAARAEEAGLALIMYEGGTHVTAAVERVDDERLTAFFQRLNYAPEMARLYQTLLDGWIAAGGRMFNAFVDVAPPSKWGSWGALRHLDDSNPRWDVLMAHNASGPVDWQPRDPVVFANGRTVLGGEASERIEGTARPDALSGGAGDDLLVSGGGSDALHGGPGRDRALLPGARSDYEITAVGDRRIATRGRDRVVLVAIEELSFEAEPETAMALE
ncbi:calcium-binding protein [Litorisediminicola beolgyonensis]|uniref:Calcium-binding protein n=1 Tax=Litorisediminicola beolgyonensis TaxID=1173614 RepID=A0ABW3ZGC1_9RHOB